MLRTWFVTGAARGLGRAFVEAALGEGDRVVATARTPSSLDGLRAEHPGALLVLPLDVSDRAAAFAAVDEAVAWAGRLDVIVNNAGYGLVGGIEEVSESEARSIVDVNLFGPLWVSQAVLPHLRRQGSGHIVQISTSGAVGSMPTLGLYNAGKWGLEGFSEAMAAELAPFGIRVTIAELGGFDTDWAGSSMRFAAPVAAYDELRTSLFGTAEVPWPTPTGDDAGEGTPDADVVGADAPGVVETDDGDDAASADAPPRAAAAALLAHVNAEDGPLRLLVGGDVAEQVAMALDARRTDYGRDPRFTWPTG